MSLSLSLFVSVSVLTGLYMIFYRKDCWALGFFFFNTKRQPLTDPPSHPSSKKSVDDASATNAERSDVPTTIMVRIRIASRQRRKALTQ